MSDRLDVSPTSPVDGRQTGVEASGAELCRKATCPVGGSVPQPVLAPATRDELADLLAHLDLGRPFARAFLGELRRRVDPELPAEELPHRRVVEVVGRAVGEHDVAGGVDVGAGVEEDLRVVVHDGKTHPVDSKEVAFVAAGRKAFLDALAQAQPVVLEPVVTINILAPASAIGNIAADLAAMRARINDREVLPNRRAVIKALVPLVELENYAHRLKAQTSGEGLYTLELSHYEPAPPKLQMSTIADTQIIAVPPSGRPRTARCPLVYCRIR